MNELLLTQILMAIGVIFLSIGIFILLFSKKFKEETLLDSGKKEVRILGRGNPIVINRFFVPSSAVLRIKFKEREGRKVVFKIIRNIRINHTGRAMFTEEYTFPYGEKMYDGKEISFKLEPDPNSTYILKAESDIEGISEKGIEKAANLFEKYSFEVKKEGNKYMLRVDYGYYTDISFILNFFQPILCSEMKGAELRDALIADARNTGFDKHFLDWYLKYPTLFDELSEIARSESPDIATRIGTIEWNLLKVEKPYEWLFNVGLTFITTGVVIFLSGLK